MQHDPRVELADLNQAQVGRPGFAQQTVELFGVFGVHQHVHRDLFTDFRQCAADFQIAQVCAHQHLAAVSAQLVAQQRRVDDFDLFDAQPAVPDIEFVEHGVGERHELAEHPPMARAQFVATAPVGQALLVLPGTVSGTAPEQEEVQDDAVQHRAQYSTAQHFGAECGELHQPETAALLAVGPVLFVGTHVRHRRQRIRGERSNMPKNSRVCMLEISTLSWNIRKCETPSSG
ncbi:hypothetical protein D3C84_788750 [compost metagenome]